MNNSNHNQNNSSSNSQQWMMNSERGSEPYSYMGPRPPGSVLPPPQHHSNQQASRQQQQQQHQQQEEESVSPPAQALDYDHPRYPKGGNRAVIPSKRAAQNRAAQKAFRQRREQYIKDLEIKAKEMEDWQDEMDRIKKENAELRERVITLENQVTVLTGGDPSKLPVVEKQQPPQPQPQREREVDNEVVAELSYPSRMERSMSLPDTPPIRVPSEDMRRGSTSPVSIPPQSVKRLHNESRLRHEQHDESGENNQREGTFAPVPLRAPNQTGFDSISYHSNDHTNPISSNHNTIDIKRRKLDNSPSSSTTSVIPQPSATQHIGQAPISTNSNTSFSPTSIMQNTNTSPTSNNILSPIRQPQHQLPQPQIAPPSEFWNQNNVQQLNSINNGGTMGDFDLDFDFDPFFEEEFGPTITSSNDFLPNANSGQVLDDLFAMLQTRQRPQIPIVPADENVGFNNTNSSNMM